MGLQTQEIMCACGSKAVAKGLCKRHYSKEWQRSHNGVINARNRMRKINPKYRLMEGKSKAKRRGLSWNLSLEQYAQLVNQPCTYCNEKKIERGVGLDRIDNSKGYEIENVLPCCSNCNYTRGDRYTVEETKVMVKALMDFRRK